MALEPLPEELVIEGPVSAASHAIGSIGSAEVGVWEISGGVSRDIEADEIFVVLSGHGTVEFEDGEVIVLRAGTVVRLHAGDRSTWRISETLRKLYVS